jgi:6-phosphofructokinase 1
MKATLVAKNIGYELRCAIDSLRRRIVRDLGYCAAKFLLAGSNAAMISMQGGHFVPIPFSALIDSETGRARCGWWIRTPRYAIARRYAIRLRRDDFDDPHELAKFAATAGLSLEEFRRQFEYLVEDEPPPLIVDSKARRRRTPPRRTPQSATSKLSTRRTLRRCSDATSVRQALPRR